MHGDFAVYSVDKKLSESMEPMGTKSKFWYRDDSGVKWLFKETREGTGEDWAEKVAAEIAALISIPHASYELATCGTKRGVVSRNFLPDGSEFIPGNEILVEAAADYPELRTRKEGEGRKSYRTPEHVISLVIETLSGILPPLQNADLQTAADFFVGYLLLDALIGNGDRHHENWGILLLSASGKGDTASRFLAPTFDHASSLGRNESDDRRLKRLISTDSKFNVEGYAKRGRSAFYERSTDKKPLTTFEVFQAAGLLRPVAACHWLNQLESGDDIAFEAILKRIPESFMSNVASQFAQRMLKFNKERLLGLKADFS